MYGALGVLELHLAWSVGNVTRCGNGTGKKTPGGAGTHKQGTHGTHRNTDHTDEPHISIP